MVAQIHTMLTRELPSIMPCRPSGEGQRSSADLDAVGRCSKITLFNPGSFSARARDRFGSARVRTFPAVAMEFTR